MATHGDTHDALDAVFFHIGNWEIRTYSICILLGMLASIGTIWYFWRREKYSSETLLLLTIVIIPSSILGARIWYEFGKPPTDTNPFFAFWDGGLSIQGGVIGAAIGGITVAMFHRNVMDVKKGMSFIFPNVLIGQVIGRWGNFGNHEVFGGITSKDNVSWLGTWITENMHFFAGNSGATNDGYYVPLFFYESIINIFGWILLVWIFQTRSRRKIFKPGSIAGLYLVWYGIVRAILEPFRNSSDILRWDIFGYSMDASVATAIMYIVVGVGLFVWFQFLPNKYRWNDRKYTWEIPIDKISKRRLNYESNKK